MKKNYTLIAIVILTAAFFSASTTIAQTTITSFTPNFACVGSTPTITIDGTGFAGATSVTFNGTPATFTVVSPIQITATVPGAATTGPIQVVSPSGMGTSATNFNIDSLVAAYVTIAAVAPSPNTGTGPFTVCTGTTYYFTTTVVNGGSAPSYQWWDGAAMIGTSSPNLTYAVNATSTIYCVVTYGGTGVNCPDMVPATSNTIAFNPVAAPNQPTPPVGLSTVCPCQAGVSYSSITVGASSYTWTVTGGNVIMSGQGSSSIIINWTCTPGTYTISVTPYNICGIAGPPRTMSVTVSPFTPPPALTIVDVAAGPTNIPQFTTIDFSALFIDPYNISKTAIWKVDGIPVFSTATSTSATYFIFPNPGSFTYTFATPGAHSVTCEITFSGQPAPLACYSPNVSVSNTIVFTVTPIGIGEIEAGQEIVLYPNPSINQLTIENTNSRIDCIEMYNAFGERVLKSEIKAGASGRTTIDVHMLPAGIYFIKLRVGEKTVVKKMVKM